MDNFFMSDVVAELAPLVEGRTVLRIIGSGPFVAIDLGQDRVLAVRLDQASPGLYLASAAAATRQAEARQLDARRAGTRGVRGAAATWSKRTVASPFVLLLNSKLAGCRLVDVRKPAEDRIVSLSFDPGEGRGGRYALALYLTGRSANAFLLGNSRRLEGASNEKGSARLPSIGFEPDTAAEGSTADFMSSAIAALKGQSLSREEILKHYFGAGSPLGPELRREFERRIAQSNPPAALGSILADLNERGHVPVVYSRFPLQEMGALPANPSRDLVLSCIELSLSDEMAAQKFESFSAAASAYYDAIDRVELFNIRYGSVTKALSGLLKKDRALLRSIQEDIARFDEPARFKRWGDLLLANLATARRTRTAATVKDFFDEAEAEIEIKLEEGESLQAAAARYYGFYQRARRALKVLEPKASALALRIAKFEQADESLRAQPTFINLSVIEKRIGLDKEGQPVRRRGKLSAKDKSSSAVPGRRFVSSEGYEIVVGKSDRDNDTITFRIAGSQDIWLHAADYPGSHVVIRNPQRQPVPFKTIVEAAEIAAHYSQAKKEKKAAVHYTQKKFVTKPPKAKPGLVRLSSFKTVMVEPGIKVKKAEEAKARAD